MAQDGRSVGIVSVSRKPVTRWATRGFAPFSVLPDVPAMEPGTLLSPPGDVETYYAGSQSLRLHSGETAHYRDNLAARPSIWVAMRPDRATGLILATVDPYEGEALAGDPGLVVAALDMPGVIQAWIADFVAAYHVEHVFHKRKRKRADPDALVRGAKRVLDKDEFLP